MPVGNRYAVDDHLNHLDQQRREHPELFQDEPTTAPTFTPTPAPEPIELEEGVHRVIKLKATNFKRLEAVTITPKNGQAVITISGPNGAGKTSVLDAIQSAIAGKSKMPTRPVRDGQPDGEIVLDLGHIVVKRRFKADGSTTITVTGANGAKYSSPQAVLDALYGDLTFDPLAFTRMQPRQQVERLLAVCPLDVDLDALARDREDAFTQRTDANREVKRLEGVVATAEAELHGERPQPVNIANVLAERKELEKQEAAINAASREVAAATTALERADYSLSMARERVEELRKRLQEAEKDASNAEDTRQDCLAKVNALQDAEAALTLPDFTDVDERLESAEDTNNECSRWIRMDDARSDLAKARAASDALTATIAEIDQRKTDALAAAQLPVPGMGFDATGITLTQSTGAVVPLSDCAFSEQLRAAIGIAMAANPSLRIIRVSDGSLLDSASMAMLDEMARTHRFQAWVETVDETGTVGVVINEGRVAAVN